MSDIPLPNTVSLSAAPLLINGVFRIRILTDAQILAQFLADLCPNPRLAVVGISEILVNAIEHGNLGITSDEKTALQNQNIWLQEIERRLSLPQHQHQYVDVAFTRTATEIQIKVTDQGKGFDVSKFNDTESKLEGSEKLKSSHGRGILLAKQLAFKSLSYSQKGNEVTCVIAL